MPIIAKASGSGYIPAPAGTWAAVCVDVVDLGMLKVSFGGKDKTQHKIRIVWQISEVRPDNKPFEVSKRYTLSLHEKAGLRKDLESWRGKPFSQSELEGFDVETVLGVPCMLNIIKQEKGADTYANVTAIMRLPKGMEAPSQRDYVRVCDRKPAEGVGEAMPDYEDPYGGHGITDDDVPFRRRPQRGGRAEKALLQMRRDKTVRRFLSTFDDGGWSTREVQSVFKNGRAKELQITTRTISCVRENSAKNKVAA